MVIPTVEVLVCAGGILFPADGMATGAEGTLPGDPPLADVWIGPAGDVGCMTLDNDPELVEVT